MVMTHFYQRNVFESCLKIFARLRAKILQTRGKTGHFGVKTGITISSSKSAAASRGSGVCRERWFRRRGAASGSGCSGSGSGSGSGFGAGSGAGAGATARGVFARGVLPFFFFRFGAFDAAPVATFQSSADFGLTGGGRRRRFFRGRVASHQHAAAQRSARTCAITAWKVESSTAERALPARTAQTTGSGAARARPRR